MEKNQRSSWWEFLKILCWRPPRLNFHLLQGFRTLHVRTKLPGIHLRALKQQKVWTKSHILTLWLEPWLGPAWGFSQTSFFSPNKLIKDLNNLIHYPNAIQIPGGASVTLSSAAQSYSSSPPFTFSIVFLSFCCFQFCIVGFFPSHHLFLSHTPD